MIRFHCPHCRATLECPEAKAGAAISCPGCKRPMRIPDVPKAVPVRQGQPPPLARRAQPQPEETLTPAGPQLARSWAPW
jgi:hypothetical protein